VMTSQKFDYNVVVVDWSTGAAQPLYIDAMVNTRVVGACSAQLGLQMGVAPLQNALRGPQSGRTHVRLHGRVPDWRHGQSHW
jgi:hypothetical protein